MSHIQFGNFSIDFSKLREGSEVDKNNEFLKSYDFDGNSIFSSNELNALQEDIEQTAGKDKTIQENEAIALLAKKLKLDPAIMASPLITTLVDAGSILLYFSIATALLKL